MSRPYSSYATPLAIVVAGFLIAGVVFWSNASGSSVTQRDETQKVGADFRLPDQSDHVRGNSDAPVAIIEFSDFECPFCAQLHPTLAQIIEENKDAKWIFRHFPLTSIHSRAWSGAVASECVAKLDGNDAFWSFTDAMFANQKNLGDSFYAETAAVLGIDAEAFASCVQDENIAETVQEDSDEAVRSGGRGTPYVVVLTASGKLVPFSGALPYDEIRRLVNEALTN